MVVLAAVGVGLVSTAVAGGNPASLSGLFESLGPPLLGALVGGIARLFTSTSIPLWMFWFSVVTLSLQLVAKL